MFDYVAQLRTALADPCLARLHQSDAVDDAARDAAFAVAVALGHCRISGQRSGDTEGPVAAATALDAAEHGCWLGTTLLTRFEELLDPARITTDSFHDLDIRCSIIQTRDDLWAASVVIDETEESLALEDPLSSRVTDQLIQLDEITSALDDILLGHIDELSPVVGLPLLDNMRSGVGEALLSSLPWWLNGTIEQAAARARDAFLDSMPEPTAMAKALYKSYAFAFDKLPRREPSETGVGIRRHRTALRRSADSYDKPAGIEEEEMAMAADDGALAGEFLMASDKKSIESFNRAANDAELWRLRGLDLHTAAEVLRQKALESMHQADWPNLSLNDPGIADCFKYAGLLFQAAMVQGFAVECLLKCFWITQGNPVAADGEYKIAAIKKENHDLVQIAAAVGFTVSAEESVALEKLSVFARSFGRTQLRRSGRSNGWSRTNSESTRARLGRMRITPRPKLPSHDLSQKLSPAAEMPN